MYKCKNCGTDFEGNFCPECGAKRVEQLICPECGTVVEQGSKFCNICGRSLKNDTNIMPQSPPSDQSRMHEQAVQTSPKYEKAFNAGMLSKLHTVFKYLPTGLFMLFSLLLFAFFAADVAYFEVDGGTYLGKITESFGTVYADITESIPDIKGCIVTLYIFLVVSLILSAVMVVSLFVNRFKNKTARIGNGCMAVDDLLVYISLAVLFIFFIVGIAMMATVNSFADGIDEIYIGGAPKLILSFSLIFGVLCAAIKICDKIVCKKIPSKIETDNQPYEKTSAGNHSACEMQRSVFADGKHSCIDGKPVFPKVTAYVKMNRALKWTGNISLLLGLCLSLFIIEAVSRSISKNIVFYASLAAFFLLVVVGIVCAFIPVRAWAVESLRNIPRAAYKKNTAYRQKKPILTDALTAFVTAVIITSVFFLLALISVIIQRLTEFYPALFAALLILLFNIAGVIACTVLRSHKKRLALHFYGTEKPDETTPAKVEFDFEKENAFYTEYKRDKSLAALYSNGTASRKIGLVRTVISGIIVVGIIVCLGIFNVIFSPFNANCVSLLRVKTYSYSLTGKDTSHGIRKEKAVMLLGEPDVKEDMPNANNKTLWAYFDSDYLSVYKRAKKLEEQLKKATEEGNLQQIASFSSQMEKLRLSSRNMVYKCLLLYFDDDELVEVRLNTKTRGDGTVTPKMPVDSHIECDKEVWIDLSDKQSLNVPVSYYSGYTDGSYRQGTVLLSVLVDCVLANSSSFADVSTTVTWSDDWAKYSANVFFIFSDGDTESNE